MSGPLTPAHDALLSRLEQIELRLLSWGRVDGTLGPDEVQAHAEEIAGDAGAGRALVDDLLDAHLLLDVGGAEELLRTRFAESVRLIVRNRQLLHGRPWEAAAQLVNDFRVLARPRRFPRRDVDITTLLERLGAERPVAPAEEQALRGMLADGDGTLRLAAFQVDATARIRAQLAAGATSATIVCAGTGSGKTKAFYLPALASVAADGDDAAWSRVLAIYPRNELLKDQLAEALAQVEAIAAHGGPVLGVGALFGPTVHDWSDLRRMTRGGWKRVQDGFACRYLRCPRSGCAGDLVWPETAGERGVERVRCATCGWESREGQLALTRERLRQRPPHLLFTTTEMLNRGLSDAAVRPSIVGATAARRPRMLLLDEVHAYGGVHGAHVALMLRRWRHALGPGAPLHVVGLSATLEEPADFMRTLAGVADVAVVRPREEDMADAAAEYALVLRGNPVSGTQLLSTTIQTAFLAARLQEPRGGHARTGTSGSRVFAFTDNLDVTNRLYWNLRDAEGHGNHRGPLAQLRAPGGDEEAERDRDGQVWTLPQRLGWRLDSADRLVVGRTSSQDAGVDPRSDVVVATASLEVGFDDPEVGTVLQHKAPHDEASFIQRKGRAGRSHAMRPWTLVVLSDYGRDRSRYQAFESLFAPVLTARSLPVDNQHAIKQQAAFALLDWLLGRVPALRSRLHLTRRRTGNGGERVACQRAVADTLRGVLEDPRQERDLARHVRRALGLTPEQTAAAMWSAPRALMTSAVPTLLRRIDANWMTPGGGQDRIVDDVPLPEHAPRALFSDLNLPEVTVVAPRRGEQPPRETGMPIVQALSEFLPGRASRRFGVEESRDWHWIPLPEPAADGALRSDVAQWAVAESVGELHVPGEPAARRLLRPWRLELERPPRERESANARPHWTSVVTPAASGWEAELPATLPARRLLASLLFHTHALGSQVRVDRGISHVAAEDEHGIELDVELVHGADPVALGFSADVDAVRLRLRAAALPAFADLPEAARRAIRTSWFEQELRADPLLRARLSPFTCGWLAVLYLAAVAGVAIAEGAETLADAVARVEQLGIEACTRRALEAVFVVDAGDRSRGLERLEDALEDPAVVEAVARIARQLADDATAQLDGYARAATVSTAAAALREAFQRMAPTFDAEALVIDVAPFAADAELVDVWLTEPDVGSGGTVEELRRRTGEDPVRLARLLAAAVGPTDYELVDGGVRRLLGLAERHDDVREAFAATRAAQTAAAATAAQRDLRGALRRHGLSADHAMLATLNLRVLRPGSDPATDAALTAALDVWDASEARLGIELDARSVAYAMSRQGSLTLEQTYSLLWPRGRDARAAGLDVYSRFGELARPERLTLVGAFDAAALSVAAGAAAHEQARAALAEAGIVRLTAPAADGAALRTLATRLLTEGIDVGSVTGHPRIVGAERSAEQVALLLELPEAAT